MGEVSLMWAAVTGMPQHPATPAATEVEESTLVEPRLAKGHTVGACCWSAVVILCQSSFLQDLDLLRA